MDQWEFSGNFNVATWELTMNRSSLGNAADEDGRGIHYYILYRYLFCISLMNITCSRVLIYFEAVLLQQTNFEKWKTFQVAVPGWIGVEKKGVSCGGRSAGGHLLSLAPTPPLILPLFLINQCIW